MSKELNREVYDKFDRIDEKANRIDAILELISSTMEADIRSINVSATFLRELLEDLMCDIDVIRSEIRSKDNKCNE